MFSFTILVQLKSIKVTHLIVIHILLDECWDYLFNLCKYNDADNYPILCIHSLVK